MAVKTERLEARVSSDDRARIERAASASGVSVSTFLVSAAVERADEVIADTMATTVPAEYFDELLRTLDVPDPAPRLAKAARRARTHPRIASR